MDQGGRGSVCVYPAIIKREQSFIKRLWNLQSPEQNGNAEPFPLCKNYQYCQDSDNRALGDSTGFLPVKMSLSSDETSVTTDCDSWANAKLWTKYVFHNQSLLKQDTFWLQTRCSKNLYTRQGDLWERRAQPYSFWCLFWFLY